MKVLVDYPTMEEEMAVIDIAASTQASVKPSPVVSLDTIRHAQQVVNRVYLDEKVKRYIVSLVHATRRPDDWCIATGVDCDDFAWESTGVPGRTDVCDTA